MSLPAPPVTVPVNLALVGCGQIARLHAERVAADSRGRLLGLFDPVRAAAENLQRQFAPAARVFDRLEDLLDSDGLHAAVICTPTSLHYEQVLACRTRGLHVLCEKPLADTRDRIAELVAASQTGPVLSVAYQRRYAAIFRTLRREVRSGRWGAVRAVASHNCEHWQQLQALPGMWRDDPRINPGGFVGDAGSHKLDTVFFVTGLQPVEAFAHSDRFQNQVEINTTLSARLSGGVALSMSFLGNAHHFSELLHIACVEADLVVREGRLWRACRNELSEITDLEPESNPIAGFLDCLTGAAPNAAPAECALPVFDLTRAMLQSSQTGQVVRVGD